MCDVKQQVIDLSERKVQVYSPLWLTGIVPGSSLTPVWVGLIKQPSQTP